MVIGSLKHLISDRQLMMEEERQALILGWWSIKIYHCLLTLRMKVMLGMNIGIPRE